MLSVVEVVAVFGLVLTVEVAVRAVLLQRKPLLSYFPDLTDPRASEALWEAKPHPRPRARSESGLRREWLTPNIFCR